jgi:ABC-2 type transport system ATP-binding protein
VSGGARRRDKTAGAAAETPRDVAASAGRATPGGVQPRGVESRGTEPRGAVPLLELREVTVRFGRTVALDSASLHVNPGDTIAVLGPDGAGKSTLLRVMAGLARPASGTVRSTLGRGALGYAGSTFDLYGELTVAENLEFFGRLRGMERERLETRKAAMLSLTGLRDARDRLAGRLSGGMKKGLSLACALVHEPPLLLLDEPTVGVDPVSKHALWDIIMQVVAGGTATVFTSCYLEEAVYASRLAAMAGGRLVETTADQILAESAGWSAWVQPCPDDRTEVRARLARVEHEPRVYLRPEGLTVLARDESAARRLLAATVGEAFASRALARGELTFEDAFVLMEGRSARGERALPVVGGEPALPVAGNGRMGAE